jgi:hypothetical protein
MMRWKIIAVLLAMVLAVVLVGSAVFAQTGDGFDLSWNVMGGGGAEGPLAGSGFSLRGTIGQTAIGTFSDPKYRVGNGYWYGIGQYYIYFPLVMSGSS